MAASETKANMGLVAVDPEQRKDLECKNNRFIEPLMIALSIGRTFLSQSNRAASMLPLTAVVLSGTASATTLSEVCGDKASMTLISQARSVKAAGAVETPAPIQPVLITAPKTAEFPGSKITLTQPVNILQPIPPATSKIPQPLN